MSDESIFREVDEELRRERLREYWNKYGLYVVGTALAIVVCVGGYKLYQYWSAQRAASAGETYMRALTLDEEGKHDGAIRLYRQLAENGPKGYRILSRLRMASSEAADGKTDEAVRTLDALAAESSGDRLFEDFARIQAAMLRVDKADYSEMQKRLGPMTAAGNSWRHSARELLGLSAYRTGNMEEAEKRYNEVLADQAVPQNLRRRAEMMLALIVEATADKSSSAEKAKDGAGDGKKTTTN